MRDGKKGGGVFDISWRKADFGGSGQVLRCLLGVPGQEGDLAGSNRKCQVVWKSEETDIEDFDGLSRIGIFKRGVCGFGVVGG